MTAKIMGVLNVTPDSFSDGSHRFNISNIMHSAQYMIEQGANIIDIGGESTRPNSKPISLKDEITRVIPVIQALTEITDIPISIDTSKPEVMIQAIESGASMINDVCALSKDSALETARELGVDICLMHMQGVPKSMQLNPVYNDVIEDIKHFFSDRIEACINAGISEEKLILDPGFGFGKTYEHNLEILRRFDEFKNFGLLLLAGISRKVMIGQMLGNRDVNARVTGSVVGAIIAVQNGADIVRVHDVGETKDALMVLGSVS
jgi:dihydropteroate synthase